MSAPLILAIDTSFGPVSATLATMDLRIVGRIEADNLAGTQAETLPPIVAKLFEGHDFKQLTRVAVTVGPGAFTGVRVGLAFAKGLRLATGAEVLGFSTLDCLAAQAAAHTACASAGAVIDAKRGEVYVQAFSHLSEPLSEAAVAPIAEASALLRRTLKPRTLLIGSGAQLLDGFGDVEIVPFNRIDTELLARRAALADPKRYQAVPAYLRAPDARLPA
ncbi:MAG: tRNA (adenosine(37)-N6)-threonylcarbamoyltransferase complex dimerization subunit type 1 TsaB [Micropepsaceae bacterium]